VSASAAFGAKASAMAIAAARNPILMANSSKLSKVRAT
jgi:hypothetical protein